MTGYAKPLPVPTAESRPFWEGCRNHEFLLPNCRRCHSYWFPPTILCPECLSTEWDWVKASGRGRVYSFGVYHRLYHPGFREDVPYVLAVVSLDEGPRVIGSLVDCAPEDVECEIPIEVVFEDVTDEVTLFKFRKVAEGKS